MFAVRVKRECLWYLHKKEHRLKFREIISIEDISNGHVFQFAGCGFSHSNEDEIYITARMEQRFYHSFFIQTHMFQLTTVL